MSEEKSYHQYKIKGELVTEEVFYQQLKDAKTVEIFLDDFYLYLTVPVQAIMDIMGKLDVTCHPMKYDLVIYGEKGLWTLDTEVWDFWWK